MCKQCNNTLRRELFALYGQLAVSQENIKLVLNELPKCPAMKALESLTPSGSEFYEDPKFCETYIPRRMDHLWDMAKRYVIERKNCAKELEKLRDVCKKAGL